MIEQQRQVERIPRQVRFTLPISDLVRTIIGGLAERVERSITDILPSEILRRRKMDVQLEIINECCVHLTPFARKNLIRLIDRIQTIRDGVLEIPRQRLDPIPIRIEIAQAIDTDPVIHELFAGSASDLFDPRTLEVILTHGEFIQAIHGILSTEIENPDQLVARLILVLLHALYIFRRDDDAISETFEGRVSVHMAYNTYIGTLHSLIKHELIEEILPQIKHFAKDIAVYLETKRGVLFEASREP